MERDERELARFGYAQELARKLGGFSSFAIAFSVVSVLTGITSTFGDALAAGGPAGLAIGWVVVSVGTMVVAVAMAELASAFPTAGALYHWAALLGGPRWGWATAMLNLVGQLAIVAAVDLACAQAIVGLAGARPGAAYVVFAAVIVGHGLLNALSVRAVAWLNDASATVHVVGVAVLAGMLLVAGRAHPLSELARTGITSRPDGSYGLGFAQALVLGVWTYTGFDAAAHVSEETHDPGRKAPRGIVAAVAVSAVAGFALVAALTLALKDPARAATAKMGALDVMTGALGPRAGRAAMGLAIVAMWFAGLSAMTSASRMLYAFARDGGVPLAPLLRRVNARTRTPVVATAACVVAPAALVAATTRLSDPDAVFLAVAALATIALNASYGLPIGLGAVARVGGRWTRVGPWNVGRAGVPVAFATVGWMAVVALVCTLANALAMEMFAVVVAGLAVLWLAWVKRRFAGPSVNLAQFERER
jgi:amino acid transporter